MHGKLVETILAQGHENIQSTNRTTFEITKDTHLTKRGNCIIAVAANKSIADLNSRFKKALRNDNAKLTIILETGKAKETATARGSRALTLTHLTDIVVRKSTYTCNRTLGINADKAAIELSPKLVENLQNPKQDVKITLVVESDVI